MAERTDELGRTTAIVLAGGRGTRLAPALAGRPKALAPVGGRPFLAHLLDRLAAAGVRHVVLATGHLGEHIFAAFGTRFGDVHLDYSRERAPRGTAGALRLAAPLARSADVLVVNGDSFPDADLGALAAWHRTVGAAATVLLAHVADASRYGRVDVDETGRVVAFVEKGEAGPGWVSAGAYVIATGLLATVPAARAVSLETEILPAWVVPIGAGLWGMRTAGTFLDIGTPAALAAGASFLEERGA